MGLLKVLVVINENECFQISFVLNVLNFIRIWFELWLTDDIYKKIWHVKRVINIINLTVISNKENNNKW